MQNDKLFEYALQTIGGILVVIGGALLASIKKDNATLWREHGNLRISHDNLRTEHSALSARVSAERADTLRSLDRVESTLETINRKLDELADALRGKD